jgi:Na+/H+ antiporter NhaA
LFYQYVAFRSDRFEFLTTQICFLQGLLNWLAAVAVDLVLPKEKETKSARRMNKCLAAWLISMIIWMLAFYNHHLSFYSDYFGMIRRWIGLFVGRYITPKPIRPLSFLYIPSFLYSIGLTWKAFRSPPEQDEE